jgi:glycosyltransferase involved in cell wall biosynthesis
MKKNILIVIDKLDYHGASINGPARYYSWLLKEIDKEKFNIWFCSLRKRGPSHELFAGSNMLYLGHHKYYPFSFISIIKIIKKYNIELLHLSGYASETFGRLAALYTKTPVIIQEHWVDPDFGGIIKLVEKRLSNITTRAVAISEFSKEFLIKQKGIPEGKVRIIKNGIPLSKFNIASKQSGLELKKNLGLDLTKKVVGIVGMLHENKGHSLFIQAAKQVIETYGEDVYFVIVGEGELREHLEAEILDKGIQTHVFLVGQQSDMPAVFQMLDIFTICSYVENAPLSLMEAMASGRSIITTDCGGPGEMIRSGENGLVVPVGDSKAIADGLIALLGDDEYCTNLGEQARNDSFKYDISRVAREFENIYDDVI